MIKWFINEDGNVYSYDADRQPIDFPGDFPQAFDSFDEATAASDSLESWNDPYADAFCDACGLFVTDCTCYLEDMYWSGTGESMADESYINYLNG